MQLSVKTIILSGVLLIAIGVAIGSKLFKPAPQIETRTVTKDKVVTVTKEVVRPDGTIERDQTRTEERKKDESVVVASPAKPDWMVTGGLKLNEQHYMIGLQRRIIGDLYVGGQVDTQRNVLATLTFVF